MICSNSSLGGQLIGIGTIDCNNNMNYKWLDEPIKNMIVKQGLNNMLMFDGSTTSTKAVSNSSGYSTYNAIIEPWGMEYCLVGSGQTPNDFATTVDLEAPISSISHYNTAVLNWPYRGVYRDTSNPGHYKIRITHESPILSDSEYIREIGYYFKLSNNSYILSSRIVLPQSFLIISGMKLITTYELNVYFPNGVSNDPRIKTSMGLYDPNGTNLDAKIFQEIGEFANNVSLEPYNTYRFNFPGLSQTDNIYNSFGNTSISLRTENTVPLRFAPWMRPGNDNNTKKAINVWYSESIINPEIGNIQTKPNYSFDLSASKPTVSIATYEIDSFYRDHYITLPHLWPNMTNETEYKDIYYLNYQNVAIHFGIYNSVQGNFTPTPWRKHGNLSYYIKYRTSFSTNDSIAWQQQNYGVN